MNTDWNCDGNRKYGKKAQNNLNGEIIFKNLHAGKMLNILYLKNTSKHFTRSKMTALDISNIIE